jgi:putative tryptophan/tyrosine transport system substrate-binding protein
MRRREFITLLSGATVTWPLTARAQQPRKVSTIGFLGAGTSSVWSQWTAAFVERLRELGWVEGRNVAIEYRSAEGRAERYSVDPLGGGMVASLAKPGGNVTGFSIQSIELPGKRYRAYQRIGSGRASPHGPRFP